MPTSILIPTLQEIDDLLHMVYAENTLQSSSPVFHILRLEESWIVQNPILPSVKLPPVRYRWFNIDLYIHINYVSRRNFHENAIGEATMQFFHPGQIESFETPRDSYMVMRGYSIHFQPEFLSLGWQGGTFHENFPFFNPTANVILKLNTEQLQEFVDLFEKTMYEHRSDPIGGLPIVKAYLVIILNKAKQLFQTENKSSRIQVDNPAFIISQEYDELVHHHAGKIRSVDVFARQMGVSAKHLSKCVKEATGKTAKELINDVVVLEAKSLLRQTPVNVSEIAYHLNFSDPAQFFKFFKAHVGMTPLEFREEK